MSTSIVRRVCAALSAVWFLAAVVAAPGVHRCPMHDGPAGTMASMPAHTMGGHMPAAPSDGGHGAHHGCTCLGTCSLVTAALLVSPRIVPVAIERYRADARFRADTESLASAASYLLPFANGPPPALRA